MQKIDPQQIDEILQSLRNQDIYVHLEMTTGAYASHNDSSKLTAATFISNAVVNYTHGSIAGNGPYRVGLKTAQGWVYSEGLTHWTQDEQGRLIMAGHDNDGKLVVALQLSRTPF